MKKKLLCLICIFNVCSMLTSCNLKDAITGNSSSLSNNKNNELSDSLNSNDKLNITNDDSSSADTTEENTTTENTTNDNQYNENAVNNMNLFEATDDSSSPASTSTTVNRNCRIFYFNNSELKTYYVDTTVPVTDNAFVTALTSKLYTSPNNSNDFLVIPTEFGVKSATLDYDTKVLKVVFNEDFTDKMSLGSATESGLISAIVDTYGYNYGVDKVSIYFGDKLYTGLKGDLPEGYFTINTSDATKLN